MACQRYEKATTLHAFAGIVNSRMSVDDLLLPVQNRKSCLTRWKQTEVLIIDEVSQFSKDIRSNS